MTQGASLGGDLLKRALAAEMVGRHFGKVKMEKWKQINRGRCANTGGEQGRS